MQSFDEKKAQDNAIFKASLISNFLYLLIHIVYLFIFLMFEKYILVYMNIGSIFIYLLFFILVKNKKYTIYAVSCGFEITIYISICTIICGFDCGFQLCLIGLCIIVFYVSYFLGHGKRLIVPTMWSVFMLVDYLFLFFYCKNNQPYYELSIGLSSFLRIVHAAVVFIFITGFLLSFIKYVVKLEEKIKHESRTDRLTNIPNRYALYNYLDSLDNKENYVLSMFDIDDFKRVNDFYGHVCGDYVLVEIANIANANSSDDFVARYGGEEFIVITKYEKDLDTTANKLDKIRKSIGEYDFEFENKKINLTITIGLAKYKKGISIDEWITMADNKLYEGKNTGKNKTVF